MNKQGTTLAYDELEENIRRGLFQSLYVFFGEEDFLIEELTDHLVGAALEETSRSFNLDIIYGAESSADHILSIVSSFPMMGERRVVLVREFDKLPGREKLLPYIQSPLPSSMLILISEKPDFRTKVYQELRSRAALVECKQLFEDKIPGWIVSRVRKLGKTIEPEAAELIRAYLGRSLREIQNELDKLFIYVGPNTTITVEDVRHLVGISRQFNIFELQKFIGRRDLPHAIEILEHMLRDGESPIGMIVMISRYIQKIWFLHDSSVKTLPDKNLASTAGIYPTFLNEYRSASRNYSPDHLKYCFSALVKTDEILKSSAMDPAAAMTTLLYRLIKGNAAN